MIGFNLFGLTHQLLALSMRLRSARHETLAANIANADTPGYRPRDIDFYAAMSEALETENYPPAVRTAFRDIHPAEFEYQIAHADPISRSNGEERLDGNTVRLDRQIAMMTENALAYETAMTLLSRTMASLRYAINEGRR